MRFLKIWIVSLVFTLSSFAGGFYENAIQHIVHSVKKSKSSALKRVYSKLYYVPIWAGEEGISYMAKYLFKHIHEDASISPTSNIATSLTSIEKLATTLYSSSSSTVAQKMDLELKITSLYYAYAQHALHGTIPWGSAKSRIRSRGGEWMTVKPPHNPISFLLASLRNGEFNFQATKPKNFNYMALEAQMKRYREYQKSGKWTKLPNFGSLRVGTQSAALPALRERLKFMGDYGDCGNMRSTTSDKCIKNALISFQKRHGLAVTGYVTKQTKKRLTESLESKIRTMSLNLDRIKWLTRKSYNKHVVINIPAFKLNFYSANKSIQTMRVITGKRKNPTPIFSDIVTTIVLNPYWNVPASILEKEMIVNLRRNPNYLKRKNMKLYSGWEGKTVDPSTVDWKQYKKGSKIPYRVAQLPGRGNALGKIKFLFPNRFAVYMHDTPTKSLFKRTVRAFSHGCIRLQDPRGLLKTFASFNKNINYSSASKVLKSSTRRALALNQKVPIDVVYLTAFVDEKGILNFRNDIYSYDSYQLKSR